MWESNLPYPNQFKISAIVQVVNKMSFDGPIIR